MEPEREHQDRGTGPADINPWVPIGAWILWGTLLLCCWALAAIVVWALCNRFDPEDMAGGVTIGLIGWAALVGWRRLDAIVAGATDAPRTKGRRLLLPGVVVAAVLGVISGLCG